jgi:hypothetical protein
MAKSEKIDSPTRWNAAFDQNLTDADFEMLMRRPEIASIDSDAFPKTVFLDGVVKYDMRANRYNTGD